MTERVLVTGGAGKLGAMTIQALQARGFVVRALAHRRPIESADEVANGDLQTGEGVEIAVANVDVVVHLAATTHARRERAYEQVNVAGTSHLVDAARSAGIRRFVHVSTRAIDPSGGAYSRSKAASEHVVSGSGLETVIVRLPEVYGTNGGEGLDKMIALARRGRPIPVVGKGTHLVCPVYVDDAVGPLAEATSAPSAPGRTYTLAGDCLSLEKFARACVVASGQSVRIVHLPERLVAAVGAASALLPLPVYPDQLARLRSPKAAASTRAARDLGFDPRPLSAGLAEALSRGH